MTLVDGILTFPTRLEKRGLFTPPHSCGGVTTKLSLTAMWTEKEERGRERKRKVGIGELAQI